MSAMRDRLFDPDNVFYSQDDDEEGVVGDEDYDEYDEDEYDDEDLDFDDEWEDDEEEWDEEEYEDDDDGVIHKRRREEWE